MTSSNAKRGTSAVPYTSLPSQPPQGTVVVLLPYRHYHPPNPSLIFLRRCAFFTISILLLCAAVYLVYPSDPDLQLVRLRLNRLQVNSSPRLTLDVSFSLTVKVRNPDLFSVNYDSLAVSVGYRGLELGFVKSDGGRVRARGSSYVNATLDLDALQVVHDAFYLIEDLAKGVIPLDTSSAVKGELGFFFFKIPIKGRVSCEVYVNVNNQSIVRQYCYPE